MKNIDIEAVKNTRAGRVFLAYKEVMSLCNVKRSGFDFHGVNDPDEQHAKDEPFEPFFKNRPQSDAEHCFGIVVLIHFMSRFYPEVIGPSKFSDYIAVAILHEIGENLIGDIPDDGTRNNAEKDAEELEYQKNFLMSTLGGCEVSSDYALFEQFINKETLFGLTTYFLDKFDAIISNLIFEAWGRPGTLSYKKKRTGISSKDAESMAITETDRTTDVWLCGLLLDIRKKYSANRNEAEKDFINRTACCFIEIVQAGAIIVRGEPMLWIDKKFPEYAGLYLH